MWNGEASIRNSIVAFQRNGAGVSCLYDSYASLECCDVYGNEAGDWVECIADQEGVNGNVSEHPYFCDADSSDFSLAENSPCAPFTPPNPECDLIGAWPVGCGEFSLIEEELPPTVLFLGNCQPNPSYQGTWISFSVPEDASGRDVSLRLFDVSGRVVADLLPDEPDPGLNGDVPIIL